jgi:hypothetical protein
MAKAATKSKSRPCRQQLVGQKVPLEKFFAARRVAAVLAAQLVDRPPENAFTYGECVSGGNASELESRVQRQTGKVYTE